MNNIKSNLMATQQYSLHSSVMASTEQYIFLGEQQMETDVKVYYFLHIIYDKINFNKDISCGIINCMIKFNYNLEYNTSKDNFCIIFEVNSIKENDIVLYCLYHDTGKPRQIGEQSKTELKTTLIILLNLFSQNDEKYVIVYDYNEKNYKEYLINIKNLKLLRNRKIESKNINIIDVITCKTIKRIT